MEALDLSNCDREPIHIPGYIQGHGFLIVLDPSLTVSHCSENLCEVLHIGITDILGKPVSQFDTIIHTGINESLFEFLAKHLAKDYIPRNPYLVRIREVDLNLIVTLTSGSLLLEFEPALLEPSDMLHQNFETIISQLLGDSELIDHCVYAAREIRDIIGYDRVMIYKFHEDGHGEVIVEEKDKMLKPFLGLHYPASDIPKQARQLYTLNLVRLISNVEDSPSPILSLTDSTQNPLDLTHAGLRAVSPIHIQYLKNMGVASSFSISLLVNGNLWGLVACHNYSPRFINYPKRQMVKLIGQILSSSIGAKQHNVDISRKYFYRSKVDEVVKHLSRDDKSADALCSHEVTMLDAVEATGAIFVYDNGIHKIGQVPGDDFIRELVKWLESSNAPGIYHTDRLPQVFSPAINQKDCASGLLACRINQEFEEYMIWFRAEVLFTVNWAGNPEKPALPDEHDVSRISPRTSFEAWSQTVRHTSAPWKSEDIRSAIQLREELAFSLSRKAAVLRLVNEKLQVAYDELDSFSHTVSHDLKNPLSTISGFTDFLLNEDPSAEDAKFMLQRISIASKKMDSMITDILKYSKAGTKTLRRDLLNMGQLLDEIKQEILIRYNQPHIQIRIENTPPVQGDKTMVMQVFSNLIGNAVKYATKKEVAKITVRGEVVNDGVQYEIIDNGIGITEFEITRIFDLFSRSEKAKEFEGSGVGLAIVKKLIEKHEGQVWVRSEPDIGSTFFVRFKN